MAVEVGRAPQTIRPPHRAGPWRAAIRSTALTLVVLAVVLVLVSALAAVLDRPALAGDVLSLAVPAFLAGALSFLSPCSLPIVLGYFSLAIQERRERIPLMTVAFLAGLATTMSVLSAGFTALGSAAIDHQPVLVKVGGLIVIGFGLLSLVGKGFAGLRIFNRPGATVGGAYLYGLIFALGWTTCVGPILGAILTMLLTQASSAGAVTSLVGGASLALVYTIGLGTPLLAIVTALESAGPGNPVSRALRGRGWEVRFAGRTWYLHTTALASGALLILLGALMMTGQMTAIGERLAGSPLAELGVEIEEWLDRTL